MADNEFYGEKYLDKVYKDLRNSDLVMHTAEASNTPKENIRKYMERLARTHDPKLREGLKRLLLHFYYERYVIKPDDISEKYFESLEQRALNDGYGHLKYSEKEKEKETIILDQRKSLEVWFDYFTGEDSNQYPMWFKYWAFQGMVKLGIYDKEKGIFSRRTKSTIHPFMELDNEALALIYDEMYKLTGGQEEIDDEVLAELINNGNFGTLYAYTKKKLDSINKEKANNEAGVWIKYNQGSNHMVLVESLQGKGTGWCTAGAETAKKQLAGGDFYVYYSYDSQGLPTIPRIAIRMEGHKIGEVRGTDKNQNLESGMEEILDKKLQEFPDRDEYKKKVADMKKLTEIYNKTNNNEQLSKEEIKFLYEIEIKILGFGYQRDPRIEEILEQRIVRQDLSYLYDCDPNQVSLEYEEITKKTIVYYGGLNYDGLTSAEGLVLPKIIIGNLNLHSLTSAKGLVLPETIGGFLDLEDLTSTEGLVLPKTIKRSLILKKLTSAKGLVLPETIGGFLNLSGLTSAEGLVLPEPIWEFLNLSGLTSAEGLVLPETIGGSLYLNKLTSAEGLVLPDTIRGDLNLNSLTSAKDLVLPNTIGGALYLDSLTNAEGLVLSNSLMSKTLFNLQLDKTKITVLSDEEYSEYYANMRNQQKNNRGVK